MDLNRLLPPELQLSELDAKLKAMYQTCNGSMSNAVRLMHT